MTKRYRFADTEENTTVRIALYACLPQPMWKITLNLGHSVVTPTLWPIGLLRPAELTCRPGIIAPGPMHGATYAGIDLPRRPTVPH